MSSTEVDERENGTNDGKKRKRDGDDNGDDNVSVSARIPKKKKMAGAAEVESGEVNEESSIYLDIEYWRTSRKELNGTFKSARKNLMQHGPWQLPAGLSDEDFVTVALKTIDEMNKYDDYSVFAKAVTEKEAPGYSDIVKHPMDFGTMSKKVKNKEYGSAAVAAAGLYDDFKQVFDNCLLYNDEDSDVTSHATKVLSLLPETYVAACVDAMKKK